MKPDIDHRLNMVVHQLTPTQKGQLTKAKHLVSPALRFNQTRAVFSKIMPREQAKHVTRRYLSQQQYQ